jgi:hypothetical protein
VRTNHCKEVLLMRKQLALVSVALIALGSPPSRGATNEASLKLTLETEKPVFTSGKDVAVRVLLANAATGCRQSAIVDSVFASRDWGSRPYSLLRFEAYDASGQPAPTVEPIHRQEKAFAPEEAVTLDCAGIIGRVISFGDESSEWRLRFKKGRYRMTVQCEMRVRSFVKAHPQTLSALLRLRAMSEDALSVRLAEGTLRSNEISFEVLGD